MIDNLAVSLNYYYFLRTQNVLLDIIVRNLLFCVTEHRAFNNSQVELISITPYLAVMSLCIKLYLASFYFVSDLEREGQPPVIFQWIQF